jgi:enediyne biosynthesis protein E4
MFMDVDNDGWPDLLMVNGHVYPEVDSGNMGSAYREPRVLYWNQGDGKFKDVSKESGPGITEPQSSRGLAVGDLWNDGRLEAVVNNVSDYPLLLVNLARNDNHWLGIHLTGVVSNRDGIGARVVVHGSGSERTWVDEVRSGSSYSSNNDMRLHFGLGHATSVRSIEVWWPNGKEEVFPGAAADQMVNLKEGSGKPKAH